MRLAGWELSSDARGCQGKKKRHDVGFFFKTQVVSPPGGARDIFPNIVMSLPLSTAFTISRLATLT